MTIIRELEKQIKDILTQDGKDVSFQYDWIDIPSRVGNLLDNRGNFIFKQAEVVAFTTNKTTGEKFLLKSSLGETHAEALQKILDFVNKSKNTFQTFTVHWTKIENGNLGSYNTSFFYCHDMLEVVNKFFVGKSPKDYVIYDIKLNPIS